MTNYPKHRCEKCGEREYHTAIGVRCFNCGVDTIRYGFPGPSKHKP